MKNVLGIIRKRAVVMGAATSALLMLSGCAMATVQTVTRGDVSGNVTWNAPAQAIGNLRVANNSNCYVVLWDSTDAFAFPGGKTNKILLNPHDLVVLRKVNGGSKFVYDMVAGTTRSIGNPDVTGSNGAYRYADVDCVATLNFAVTDTNGNAIADSKGVPYDLTTIRGVTQG